MMAPDDLTTVERAILAILSESDPIHEVGIKAILARDRRWPRGKKIAVIMEDLRDRGLAVVYRRMAGATYWTLTDIGRRVARSQDF